MKRFAFMAFMATGILLTGCIHFKSKPAKPIAAPSTTVVTPDNSLSGKVVSYNSAGRFMVLNFPSRRMPHVDSRLFLYRVGLKVAEVKITGPQNDDNIVADLISGDARPGDEVRDQ